MNETLTIIFCQILCLMVPCCCCRYSIHGWNGHTRTCSNAAIKDAYLEVGDFNVILVDWSDFALDVNFLRVVPHVSKVAQHINMLSRLLHHQTGVQYRHMYLIGHSLGCHIAGMAGKLLQSDKYGVIYALDTSGPVHRLLPAEQRLVSSDALYVEAIHTDMPLLGLNRADAGHASFYPNWGLGQPHCPNVTTDVIPDFACDHFGSLYYFVESLRNSKAFGAIKCKSFRSIREHSCSCGAKRCAAQAYMGGDPATPKRGIYNLSTRRTQPFGYGDTFRMQRPLQATAIRLRVLQ